MPNQILTDEEQQIIIMSAVVGNGGTMPDEDLARLLAWAQRTTLAYHEMQLALHGRVIITMTLEEPAFSPATALEREGMLQVIREIHGVRAVTLDDLGEVRTS